MTQDPDPKEPLEPSNDDTDNTPSDEDLEDYCLDCGYPIDDCVCNEDIEAYEEYRNA